MNMTGNLAQMEAGFRIGIDSELANHERSARQWIEQNLVIRNKDGEIVPFQYNPIQARLDEAVAQLQAQGKPVRIIILKARQEGASTWTEGRIYEKIRRQRNQSALIISHELESSNHLYGMFERFHAHDPQKLPTDQANRKRLKFSSPHGSEVLVSTAEKAHAGSSTTNQALHISELAKWPRAEQTMLSLMQTVPDNPTSFVIVESTAFGATGYFKRLWDDAVAGRNEWMPIFFAWYDLPEYQMPVGTVPLTHFGTHPRYNASPGEEDGLRQQGVTDEQLTWRRYAINNRCGGDVELFHQEFPANAAESFLHSGRPRFDTAILARWKRSCVPPIWEGTIDIRGQLVEGEVGSVRIWENPVPGEQYIIGADCAEGVPGGDYSAGAVLRKSTRQQVATIHGHLGEIESDAYGHLLEHLGYHYNTALIAPEINAYGRAVVEYLLKRNYPRLYHRPSQGKEEVDYSNQVGWQTNSATKPVMISDLAAAIRDESIDIPEKETVHELLGYLVLDNGKTGNAPDDSNSHDDRVMRLAIAIQALNYVSTPPIKGWDDRRHIRKVVRALPEEKGSTSKSGDKLQEPGAAPPPKARFALAALR